ncbi:hypothetical protein [Natrinema pallidum]|uniref:hypothetical protein n=1 Tax=Natrinema pallidum TaxID=69527 RepID=UPI0015866B8F|nr:hypothetical protein [Natrinema pallidum]
MSEPGYYLRFSVRGVDAECEAGPFSKDLDAYNARDELEEIDAVADVLLEDRW